MRRLSVSLIVTGVLMLIAAVLWNPVVVPKLVKFPADTDLTMHYSGQLLTYQQPGQSSGIANSTPLLVDRRIQSIGSQTGAHVALVRETVTAHIGDQTQVQTQVYAFDRRTMKNVANAEAYAFAPANVVDRSGSYSLNLPMGVAGKGSQFKIFKAETGTTYNLMRPSSGATSTVNGLKILHLSGGYAFTPVTAAERAALAATGLPAQLSPAQVTAQLQAAGINVSQAVTGLAQLLTPDELTTVTQALSAPVPLQYFAYGSGDATVANRTGMIVGLNSVIDGIAAKPDLRGLQPVLAILNRHSGLPAIDAVISTLGRLATASPQRVYEMRFSQTPASVTAMVKEAKSRTHQLDLATTVANRSLFGLAALLLVSALLTFVVRPRRADRIALPAPMESKTTDTERAVQRPAA